jgi:periplasmic protein TonB
MDDLASSDVVSRQEILRWGVSLTVVLAAHVLFVVAVLARPDDADLDAGSPVVMVDLAPVASAPSQIPSDQPPAPQVQTESEERARVDVQQQQKPPEEQIDQTPTRNPDVELPQRTPDPPKQEQEAKQEQQAQDASHAAAPQSAAVTAALAAAPAPGQDETKTSAAIATWQRTLVAHLERFKRYPERAGGAIGVTRLAFRIDRQGRVLTSRIRQSSGSSALDEEALAMIKRAEPLPRPPDSVLDTDLTFTIPIRYAGAGQH